MTTATIPTPSPARPHAYRAHLLNESRLLSRDPAALIFGAVLPLLAIIVMVCFPAARRPLAGFGGFSVVQSYAPVLVLFATSILGLTSMPGILGGYRKLGVLRRLRTTPSSPVALLAALFTMITVVGLIVAALIIAIPAIAGAGAPVALGWLALAAALSTLCFVALGTVVASVVRSPQAAQGVGNVVAVFVWAASGMWFPRAAFPGWLLTVSDVTPGGAAAKAMLDATIGAPQSWQPYAVLVAWTLAACLIAVRVFRWE